MERKIVVAYGEESVYLGHFFCADRTSDSEAEADEIQRRCNAHDKLVAMLELVEREFLLECHEGITGKEIQEKRDRIARVYDDVRALLREVKGGE